MKYLILDIVLLIVAAILAFAIFFEGFSSRNLQVEIEGLRRTEVSPKVAVGKSDLVVSEQVTPKQGESEHLALEIANQKELNRVLAAAKKDAETDQALLEAGLGSGSVSFSFSPEECSEYWAIVESRAKGMKDNHQRLLDFIEILPLEQLEEEDQEFVRNYLDKRGEWAEILYDQEVSAERKVAVYGELEKDNPKFNELVDGLFKESVYGEQVVKYEKIRDELQWAIMLSGKAKIVGTQYFSRNGASYKIKVPEEPYFDPEELE